MNIGYKPINISFISELIDEVIEEYNSNEYMPLYSSVLEKYKNILLIYV
jgi:uncharacterized protein YutD